MLVNKMGYDHIINGINCQDFGLEIDINKDYLYKKLYINGTPEKIIKIKCVTDGCGSSMHSEIGAKLFCLSLQQNIYDVTCDIEKFINDIFNSMLINLHGTIYSKVDEFPIDCINKNIVNDYMCFTILLVLETEDKFITLECGDGYIIKQKLDDTLEYEKIDYGPAPKYYVYNFLNPKILETYKDGVKFTIREYNKAEYKYIGVASDGLRYILNDDTKIKFENLILQKNEIGLKRYINIANNPIRILQPGSPNRFKDDITIVI